MKDRIPTKPGRMKLTDEVTGVVSYVIAEMADEPVETGTDLNKANLLTDATAALLAGAFGTTPDTPDDAFALLAGCANVEVQSYVGTGAVGASDKTTITFQHEPKLVVILPSALSGVNAVNIGKYVEGAFLPWSAVIEAYEAEPDSCQIYTFISFTGGYQRTARYTLSNDNKTIAMWDANTTMPTPEARGQLNDANNKYTVISFY